MAPPVQLGAFRVGEPIGQGGMGIVWAGEHDSGAQVAIKVLTADVSRQELFGTMFENEVRAVAGMRHPHIVLVHDFGVVDPAAARVEPRLSSGSPYLVMERVDATLKSLKRKLDWPRLERVIRELLEALAHAHARGVVHRDLKAANVLVDPDGRTVLTDFGLAHLGRRDAVDLEALSRSGTPSHMAPEQFAGAWRDFGPWTDLYGLGVVIWSLVTGYPPFGRRRAWREAAALHAEAPLPAFVARFEVPAGLEPWLRRMLRKDPADRFGRAADALAGLSDLGPLRPPGRRAPPVVDASAPTITYTGSGSGAARPVAVPAPPVSPPQLPTDWRGADEAVTWLAGVGLGLFGLRPIPLVDREQARDALWSAAREVLDERAPRSVVLRGPAGCGKSRLASWILEQVEARGAMLSWSAVHGPTGGPLDGIGPMIGRFLGLGELPLSDRLDRTRALLQRLEVDDEDEAHALNALVDPHAEGLRVRMRNARERHVAVARLLRRVTAGGRPVVLWLDDVQWGMESLQLATHLLGTDLPLLLVLTARDEALADQPAAASLLDALASRARSEEVYVGPLAPDDRKLLVQRMLGLEGVLARQVERRTAGNPLFALQLVGDWVARGILVPSGSGFRLPPGASVELPEDVQQVWATRLTRALEGRHADDRAAFELAALLGQDVDTSEWQLACREAGVRPSPRLVPALIRQRLARAVDPEQGWSFVHGMLRESIEVQVRRAGRLPERHRQVAEALERAGARPARLGRHRYAAGELEGCLGPLMDGMLSAFRSGDRTEMEVLASLVVDALDRLGAPAVDRRRLRVELRRAEADSLAGRLAEGEARAIEARRLARQGGWSDLEAVALLSEAQGYLLRRESAPAEARMREALSLVDGQHDPLVEARIRTGLAAVAHGSGRPDETEAHLLRARRAFEASGDAEGIGRCLTILGANRSQAGDFVAARALYQESLDWYGRAGARLGRAVALNGLAMAACDLGEPARGVQLMRRCIAHAEAAGSSAAVSAGMDLATALVMAGELEEAREVYERTAASLQASNVQIRVNQCHARMLNLYAQLEDREGLRGSLEPALDLMLSDSFQRHCAEQASQAARKALALGWAEEAASIWRVARHQWSGLGRDDAVRECDEALARLDREGR